VALESLVHLDTSSLSEADDGIRKNVHPGDIVEVFSAVVVDEATAIREFNSANWLALPPLIHCSLTVLPRLIFQLF
jgi:hypothetical protein